MSRRDPERELALAVLQRMVADLRCGSREHMREAAQDIANGGVDYWIEAVADSHETAEVIRRELWKLARGSAKRCA